MGKRRTKIVATVYGDDELKAQLQALAEASGQSTSELIRTWIRLEYEKTLK